MGIGWKNTDMLQSTHTNVNSKDICISVKAIENAFKSKHFCWKRREGTGKLLNPLHTWESLFYEFLGLLSNDGLPGCTCNFYFCNICCKLYCADTIPLCYFVTWNTEWSNRIVLPHCTANEGLVRIQYKCLIWNLILPQS